ncbi:MAG TPA: sigma-54 dependent transcriptional regulator [Terriglobales bacterium]|nr:sigma-54 dependent transcriptional regulator [Terriglobales bacterium]
MSSATCSSSATPKEVSLLVAPGPVAIASEQVPLVEEIGEGLFFVCHSRAMREVRCMVDLVAQTNLPVLILGETGAGKEVVVRLIHHVSLRRSRSFLKVNCAALPSELLESELFGYEAGAFTGANKSTAGKFEACHKGTILLDEIAEMPPGPQAKLLQVLQDGEYCRLGSAKPIRVDVRVLAATNVDIVRAIKTRKFRDDLYYRLNAFSIQIPPLRERMEDIPVLLQHFITAQSAALGCEPLPLSADLLKACLRYSWPGNVRELENFVKRYLIVRDERKAIAHLQPEGYRNSYSSQSSTSTFSMKATDLKSLVRGLKEQAERQAIVGALELSRGNRKDAARILNISSRALIYKMREYGIDGAKENYPTELSA